MNASYDITYNHDDNEYDDVTIYRDGDGDDWWR